VNNPNVAKPPPLGELATRALEALLANPSIRTFNNKVLVAISVDLAAEMHRAFRRPVLWTDGEEIAISVLDQDGQFWADMLCSSSTVGPALSWRELEEACRLHHERVTGKSRPDPDKAVRAVRAERGVAP